MSSRAISLADLGSAAKRFLLGTCCNTKVGLGLNSGSAQTATITIAAKQTDDVVTVTVNGVDYEYTVLVGDANNTDVADALATLIDANPDVTAENTGAVITVTAADETQAFTISSAVTGTDHTTTAAVAITHVSVQRIATTDTAQICIGGRSYEVSATEDVPVTGAALIGSSYRWYLVSIDATGSFTVTPGADNKAEVPPCPDSTCPVGIFKVVTAADTTFTPETTALNATGVTTTFHDISVMPLAVP